MAQGRYPLAELLTLVEGHEDLDEDLWLLLKHAVVDNFGQALVISFARGKLCPPPTRFVANRSPDDQSITQQRPSTQAVFTDADTPAPG